MKMVIKKRGESYVYKLSCELCNINRFLKLKAVVIYRDNLDRTKVYRTHLNGNDYLTIKQYPYITMEIINDLEKKETWSYSKTMNLNRFDMYKFMQSANEVAEAFTSEKNLYGYDKYNHLCVNKDLANRKSVTIPLSFNRSIWITPIVIRSEETKVEMEGVAMCFDKVTNYVTLSYDEFKFLLYYLDKIDLESLSLQLITFAQLTEGKTFTSIDNLPDAREFASAQIPDKEPQNEESVSGFIPVISDETLPKI